MMALIIKILVFLTIFILGELLVNTTAFRYIRNYFDSQKKRTKTKDPDTTEKVKEDLIEEEPFLGINISILKGIIERFTLYMGLVLNVTQILIVFGTIKIGSRLAGSKKVLNDYFIIGNFTSILVSLGYMFWYNKIVNEILVALKPYYS